MSRGHPAIASLAPLGLLLLLALLIGTIGIVTTYLLSVFVINILTLLFSFLIFIAPFTNRYYIVSRNLLYLIAATASAIVKGLHDLGQTPWEGTTLHEYVRVSPSALKKLARGAAKSAAQKRATRWLRHATPRGMRRSVL